MPEIKDQVENQAEQVAYETWVTEARAHGLNGEPDIFRAGWVAARCWQREESERDVSEADTAEWYQSAAMRANSQ